MTDHRQHDDPLAGLLKRTLASQPRARADCPEPEILAAYFDRAAAESAAWEQHFSTCTRCQEQLAVLARVASAVAPAAAAPRFIGAAPSAAQPHPRPDAIGARGFASFWKLRWLAPAAAALAAATIWVVLRAPDQSLPQPGDTSTIAQNRQAPPPVSGEPSRADAPAETLSADAATESERKREGKAGLRSQPEDATACPDAIGARASKAKDDKEVSGTVGRTQAGEKFASESRRYAPPQPPSVAELPKQPGADRFEVQPMAPAEPAKRQPSSLLDTKAASEVSPEANKQKAKEEQARAADQVAALAEARPVPPPPVPPPSAKNEVAAAPARRARINEGQGIIVTRDEATKAKKADAPAAQQPAPGAVAAESATQNLAMRILPPPRGYISVPVADSQVLWRFGPAGSIERSADAGATWQRQSSGIAADLLAGSAPSASICWTVGRAGMILRTTDGGSTWQQLGSPSSLDLVAIEARDATTATVTTAEGKRYATTDAGRTWRSL